MCIHIYIYIYMSIHTYIYIDALGSIPIDGKSSHGPRWGTNAGIMRVSMPGEPHTSGHSMFPAKLAQQLSSNDNSSFLAPQYKGMHSRMMGYPSTWETSPYIGVPQYMEMHPHIRGYPSVWGCVPIFWGTPVHGDASPYIGIP